MSLLKKVLTPYGPRRLGLSRFLPYPLRAAKLSLDLNLFGFWLMPEWHIHRDLSEFAKSQGAVIWWVRWAWFQVSYSRWL